MVKQTDIRIGAYAGELVEWVRQVRERRRVQLEIVRRTRPLSSRHNLQARRRQPRSFAGSRPRCRTMPPPSSFFRMTSRRRNGKGIINDD